MLTRHPSQCIFPLWIRSQPTNMPKKRFLSSEICVTSSQHTLYMIQPRICIFFLHLLTFNAFSEHSYRTLLFVLRISSYRHTEHVFHAVPSPRKRAFTSRPLSPMTLTICGSPGTRSMAWSDHFAGSPSTSRMIPLIGRAVDNSMDSPSDPVTIFKPSSLTGGK